RILPIREPAERALDRFEVANDGAKLRPQHGTIECLLTGFAQITGEGADVRRQALLELRKVGFRLHRLGGGLVESVESRHEVLARAEHSTRIAKGVAAPGRDSLSSVRAGHEAVDARREDPVPIFEGYDLCDCGFERKIRSCRPALGRVSSIDFVPP